MNNFRYFKALDICFRTLGNGAYECKDAVTNQWNPVKDNTIGRMISKDGYPINRDEAEKTTHVSLESLKNPPRSLMLWKPKPVQLMCIRHSNPLILSIIALLSSYKTKSLKE
ncbi:MAG: hypothetical protein H0W50_07185 [Parachlamydiaceae bacterium]|nr:hypothetical protein [Parachlamydiaceae bacterium]